ncbi:hypothetical protein B0H16DRAFT_1725189 [Mycena metata]|uniref:Uncharacterized protein n=1 Tax=Mycena metata TaxID=1033252 RepID=A0AAD7N7F5_9AGAR|nr:hypothetical protein B0H16DRAFT_1725189 [Mycena metata]
MASKTWATTEQTTWLHTWMPEFVRRQAAHKLHLFWPAMLEAWAWVHKWPEHATLGLPLPSDPAARALTADKLAAVGAAIKDKKAKLENWFCYQRSKLSHATGGAAMASTATAGPASGSTAARIQAMFNFGVPKRRHVHQPVEIFQRHNPQLLYPCNPVFQFFPLSVPVALKLTPIVLPSPPDTSLRTLSYPAPFR